MLTVPAVLIALHVLAPAAGAQFAVRPVADPATGETYRVEVTGGLWNPRPEILVSSESIGIVGTPIDFIADLGVLQTRFRDLRIVLRPSMKHKFRIQYTPMHYQAEAVLSRRIVFNGIAYDVGLPVHSNLSWKTWRLGYEYDVIYRDRGFLGVIVEAKYTNVQINLDSPLASEFSHARAPIPAIGGIGRVYVMPNIAATFEMTGFKLPESIDESYRARYLDYDLYGTLNFSDTFGVQAGYRSIDVMYRIDHDMGDLKLRGPYFAGIVRF